ATVLQRKGLRAGRRPLRRDARLLVPRGPQAGRRHPRPARGRAAPDRRGGHGHGARAPARVGSGGRGGPQRRHARKGQPAADGSRDARPGPARDGRACARLPGRRLRGGVPAPRTHRRRGRGAGAGRGRAGHGTRGPARDRGQVLARGAAPPGRGPRRKPGPRARRHALRYPPLGDFGRRALPGGRGPQEGRAPRLLPPRDAPQAGPQQAGPQQAGL
ncbi:MAG: hypothetical protein AVDCRST_MAG02-2615, partial [uncultured Rubrobacteraceae bacterium]